MTPKIHMWLQLWKEDDMHQNKKAHAKNMCNIYIVLSPSGLFEKRRLVDSLRTKCTTPLVGIPIMGAPRSAEPPERRGFWLLFALARPQAMGVTLPSKQRGSL